MTSLLRNSTLGESPNRRLNHLVEKEDNLQRKVTKIQLSQHQHSYRSNSQHNQSRRNLKIASRDIINPSELVHRMIDYDPEKERQLNDIQSKPKMILDEDELRAE